jgi:ankyrin repeat protein
MKHSGSEENYEEFKSIVYDLSKLLLHHGADMNKGL